MCFSKLLMRSAWEEVASRIEKVNGIVLALTRAFVVIAHVANFECKQVQRLERVLPRL